MKLSLGTNFSKNLISQFKGSSVKCLFGKLPEDVIGGGRPSFALPKVADDTIREHIEEAHHNGIEFNYLLNSVCMDNLELTQHKNQEIVDLLDKIKDWGIDWVTVSIPYLIDLVKEKLPNVKISISSFANVDSIQKIKYYEKLGVHEITLPEHLNRNFSFLRQLSKMHTKIDIQLIATNDCLLSCQYRHHHPIFQSHASQSEHVSNGFALDYCLLKCTNAKLEDPSQYIKSPWIRPEDIITYEELGFDKFKITERLKNTESLAKIIKAYDARYYDGNLAELLNVRMNEQDFVMPDFEYNNKPDFVNVGKMGKVYNLLFSNKVKIDNRKLDGFLNFFINKNFDCLNMDCDQCGYCNKIAEEVVEVNKEVEKVRRSEFKDLFLSLSNGDFFTKDQLNIFWNSKLEDLFEKMVNDKPIFIREVAKKGIRARAEENARERSVNEISIEDLIKANFQETPKDFHGFLIIGLVNMGININDYAEINELYGINE